MTYVCKFGRPDLFIMFTFNPKWKEIESELQARLSDDIVARVFKGKQDKLMWLLKDGNIFGELNTYMYTIN